MSKSRLPLPLLVRGVLPLLVVASLAVAGCGTKTVTSTGANNQVTTQTVPNIHFANTKFLLHAGLAFGAIHRYIYKPLRAGQLAKGAPHRVVVLLKGAAAALFAVHELRIARDDALASDQLRPLANRLTGLSDKLGNLVAGLRDGSISPAALLNASGAADALGGLSSKLGFSIKDIGHAVGA